MIVTKVVKFSVSLSLEEIIARCNHQSVDHWMNVNHLDFDSGIYAHGFYVLFVVVLLSVFVDPLDAFAHLLKCYVDDKRS